MRLRELRWRARRLVPFALRRFWTTLMLVLMTRRHMKPHLRREIRWMTTWRSTDEYVRGSER